MSSQKTIFIGIASYRDIQLIPTIFSLVNEATQPERLTIAVCWQDNNEIAIFEKAGFILKEISSETANPFYIFKYKNATIEIFAFNYLESKGAGWARHHVDRAYRQQDYVLQIDSHSRMIANWDEEMINMLESLRDQSEFPVLSTYPTPFTPAIDDEEEDRAGYISRLVFNHFDDQGIPGFTSVRMIDAVPKRCAFLAAGFIFADGHYVTQVPNDPNIFFLGEEICMAARAYTQGYDIYTPSKLLLWHYYGRQDHPKIWADHTNEAKEQGTIGAAWWEHDAKSKKIVAYLLGQSDTEYDLGNCRLGTTRTLQEFQYRCGLNFQTKQVHLSALEPTYLTWNPTLPTDHVAWIESLKQIFNKKITVAKSELNLDDPLVKYWHIGVYNQDNAPIMINNFSPETLKNELKSLNSTENEIHLNFKTQATHTAQFVRFCPWLENHTWGAVLEKKW